LPAAATLILFHETPIALAAFGWREAQSKIGSPHIDGRIFMRILFPLTAVTLITVLSPALAANDPAKVEKTPIGDVLANQKGMTLYVFTRDKTDVSRCTGQCAVAWPPFAAPAHATASGGWTVITRPDGRKQWAYDGSPLYTFVNDRKPGQDKGQGIVHFGGTWEVARPQS
jgi:predicted lipoprotein with Yx(FWY)xxD motif